MEWSWGTVWCLVPWRSWVVSDPGGIYREPPPHSLNLLRNSAWPCVTFFHTIFWHYVGIDFCFILGRFWSPRWVQKWSQNRSKINQKINQFFECFLDRFLTILGSILGPKIDQKLIKIWCSTKNQKLSKLMTPPAFFNDFCFPKTSKFIKKSIQKSIKKLIKFYVDFWLILAPFWLLKWSQKWSKIYSKINQKINQNLKLFFIDFGSILGSNLGAPGVPTNRLLGHLVGSWGQLGQLGPTWGQLGPT